MFSQPKLPSGLLRTLIRIERSGHRDYDNGGQWAVDSETEEEFTGTVLPVSSGDLQYAPAGTYTTNSKKVYTNGDVLVVNSLVRDPFDGMTYTVIQELEHGPIHGMRQYVVERAGRGGDR